MPPLHLYLTTLPRDFLTPPATLHGLARIPLRNPATPSQTFRHINLARGPSSLLSAARLTAHLVALYGIPFRCTSSNFSGSLSHSSTSSAQVLLKSMCSISHSSIWHISLCCAFTEVSLKILCGVTITIVATYIFNHFCMFIAAWRID